jgi:hypothetical protein
MLDHLISGKRDGIGLVGGASFTPEPVRYKKHLKAASEGTEVSIDLGPDSLYGRTRPSLFSTISPTFRWGTTTVIIRT